MEPDVPAGPGAELGSREAIPTPLQRILRYALLPLAAIALIAGMFIVIPILGDSSGAAQDLQAQPSLPATADAAAPSDSAVPGPSGSTTAPPTHSTAPAQAGTASATPGVTADAGGASAQTVSLEGIIPTRITVPTAGIDVQVLRLDPTEAQLAAQSIVPPLTYDGYWLASYGAPGEGSTDTTYIAGHSWAGTEAPFDLFSTAVQPGDSVVLDTAAGPLDYVVDAVTTHDKDSLKDSDIWDITPHRLVIISCYTEDPWGKNVVVTASPAGQEHG
jgi:hypothetical protein